MFEKRKFPRLGESWDVDYSTIRTTEFKKSPIDSLTVNISGGGVCFEAKEEIPKGTMLAVELRSTEFQSSIMALARKKISESMMWALNSGGPDGKTTAPRNQYWITLTSMSTKKENKLK